jgi:transcriptional regulator with XRE-family HTH domain
MPARRIYLEESARRLRRQLAEVLHDMRAAREAAGLSQASVARAIRVSHQLISMWERGVALPDPIQLARLGAAVGLDVSVRAYPGGSPLRDAAQLKLLRLAREVIGSAWRWRTEVPVSSDPMDRRAFDAVISRGPVRIGLEAISRLSDVQGQVRAITLKQEAARFARVVMVLASTRHNRAALRQAEPTLRPAFPLGQRAILAALRAGEEPSANGVLLVQGRHSGRPMSQ